MTVIQAAGRCGCRKDAAGDSGAVVLSSDAAKLSARITTARAFGRGLSGQVRVVLWGVLPVHGVDWLGVVGQAIIDEPDTNLIALCRDLTHLEPAHRRGAQVQRGL